MPEPESITSLELQIPCGDRPPLGATLTLPAYPRACALILQGSGPHERDGAMPAFGFRSTLYKRLANELGTRFGIACLRYDKRGHDLPADAPRDYSLYQRLSDALAAYVVLENHPKFLVLPRFIVGHSEGGILAWGMATLRNIGKVRAVSLAAPFGDVFEINRDRAQIAALSPVESVQAKGRVSLVYYGELEQIFESGKPMSPEAFRSFGNAYRGASFAGWESFDWLRDHWDGWLQSSDPTANLIPFLAVQGGRDARLPDDNPEKWESWCAQRKLASYLFIPDMGHDLNDARRKAFVLDESLLTGIGSWIDRVLKTK